MLFLFLSSEYSCSISLENINKKEKLKFSNQKRKKEDHRLPMLTPLGLFSRLYSNSSRLVVMNCKATSEPIFSSHPRGMARWPLNRD